MMNTYNITVKNWNRETIKNGLTLYKLPKHKTSIGN